jgi:hypothetical protein
MSFLSAPFGKVLTVVVITAFAFSSQAAAQSDCARTPTAKGSAPAEILPQFGQVTGTSHDKASHILAAKDALNGRLSFPPPLVVTTYKREGRSVVIDLVADSLPTVKWTNGGGTVRIRSDGCRVILSRHK